MDTSEAGISQFDKKFFDDKNCVTFIGTGSLGGKAQSLADINNILISVFSADEFPEIEVSVPTLTVIRTDIFDAFMSRNNLYDIALSEIADDRIAHAFQKADLPFELLGDLRALVAEVRSPLAIRSSSRLEDAMYEPFAGIYCTKMTPNNQPDTDTRFRKIVEAIKFVYASTYFKAAKNYIKATKHKIEDEKMAVIIQEVVGRRHDDRYYPQLSGVARSYNYYPMNRALPEDGVVNLALGLGKTIVDGGFSWYYSPAYPKINPPFVSIGDMLNQTQTEFWSINMGKAPAYDPIKETEFMTHENITVADKDETLRYIASTVDNYSGRLSIGTGAIGPRILNFAPVLQLNEIPLNNLIKSLLSLCENAMKTPIEIEFAMTFNSEKQSDKKHRFGFLQARPMVVSLDKIEVGQNDFDKPNVLSASINTLGNGINNSIKDIVYIIPENFEAKHTPRIASEIATVNNTLVEENRPYLLIGFGRWGSSDPWLGIPVNWGQVSGVKAIIESTKEDMNVEMSQGSHFFHNLTSFGVFYFSVPFTGEYIIDWDWLAKQQVKKQTQYIRHVFLPSPLQVKVNGRNGHGVIIKPE